MFGVRGDRDSLNVTFAVSATSSTGTGNGGGGSGDAFLPSSYVKQRVYLRRDTLVNKQQSKKILCPKKYIRGTQNDQILRMIESKLLDLGWVRNYCT